MVSLSLSWKALFPSLGLWGVGDQVVCVAAALCLLIQQFRGREQLTSGVTDLCCQEQNLRSPLQLLTSTPESIRSKSHLKVKNICRSQRLQTRHHLSPKMAS